MAIRAALEAGDVTAAEVAEGFARISARPVFTAHPTEASRRSVLVKLRRIAELLDEPRTERSDRAIAEAIDLLWQTDELRLGQPEVTDEARNALFYLDDLAAGAAGDVVGEFAAAARANGLEVPAGRPVLTFGSWIGGDRDGNPFVTPAVTARVLAIQHDHAVRDLLPHIEGLSAQLSVSERIAPASAGVRRVAGRRPRGPARPRPPVPPAQRRGALPAEADVHPREAAQHPRPAGRGPAPRAGPGLPHHRRAAGRPGADPVLAGRQPRGADRRWLGGPDHAGRRGVRAVAGDPGHP